jgi:MerR family redox-sensitive transcriptional activator SoxR
MTDTNDGHWSIGRVSRRCGVRPSTLHFYESKGLIRSIRTAGNQRRYKPDVVRRISVIKAAQRLGISLEEIQAALSTLPGERTPTASDWSALSARWRDRLDRRIQGLERLRDSLSDCIGCGCLSLRHCPLYNEGDRLAAQGPGAVLLDRADRGRPE